MSWQTPFALSMGYKHQSESVFPWTFPVFDSTRCGGLAYNGHSQVWDLIHIKEPYPPRLKVWVYVGGRSIKVVGFSGATLGIGKTIVFSKASNEWNQLCIQDFKSMDAYNHIVNKFNQKHRFFEKERYDVHKIENTSFIMVPLERTITRRYHKKCFTVYAYLFGITSGKGNHELIVWNSQKRPTGYCSSIWDACHS